MNDTIKILFLGDIIGKPGRIAVRELLPSIVGKYCPDVIAANVENASAGFGITPDTAEELKSLHIDVMTTGNHVWDKKEVLEYIKKEPYLLRPANYPPGAPGSGSVVFECPNGVKIGFLNLLGRVFMDGFDCPFRTGQEIIKKLREVTPIIFLDFHAEATSEKAAVGYYFDGTVSAVIGTHTHVQTSDEKILAGGTAFITDAGMTGATDSVIGMQKEIIIQRFLTQMPAKFDVATNNVELQGVFVEVNTKDGRARRIERIKAPLKSDKGKD